MIRGELDMLAPEKIQSYKELLESERERLMGEIEAMEKPEDFGSDVADEDEEADEVEEMGNRLAIAKVKKERLQEIELALGKLANNTYGICEKCGAEIGESVLNAAPESLLCANCKKQTH